MTHTKKLFEPLLVQRVFHLITSLMDTAFAKNMAQPVRKTGYACSFSASKVRVLNSPMQFHTMTIFWVRLPSATSGWKMYTFSMNSRTIGNMFYFLEKIFSHPLVFLSILL